MEDNSDLDTSNESYISSTDSDDEEGLNQQRQPPLTREAKALVGRRFSKYFDRIGMLPENYWRQQGNHPEYDKSRWIKMTFDG